MMYKYRSLVAWQHAHKLTIETLRETDRLYKPRYLNVFDQLRRAVISIEANIVEGYALSTSPLFRKHLRIALGSAAEAECLIQTATELRYIPLPIGEVLESQVDKTIASIYGLLRSPKLHGRGD